MKLISSSHKSRHTHKTETDRGWWRAYLKPRRVSAQAFARTLWVVMVVIVAVFAFSVFHMFRGLLEASVGQ